MCAGMCCVGESFQREIPAAVSRRLILNCKNQRNMCWLHSNLWGMCVEHTIKNLGGASLALLLFVLRCVDKLATGQSCKTCPRESRYACEIYNHKNKSSRAAYARHPFHEAPPPCTMVFVLHMLTPKIDAYTRCYFSIAQFARFKGRASI